MSSPIVEISAVNKTFGGRTVIPSLDLTIQNGEFLTLLGPSGCGKTTLLRLIAGFEQPDAGRILLAGKDLTDTPPDRRDVNTVFQSYALFPHMNVFDNVAFGLRMKRLAPAAIEQRVREALAMVKLEGLERRRPHQLSGGQQQRVALARAVVNRPLVLLLDEPLSALDSKLRRAMQMELKQLQRELRITFVFVTHDQEEALSMSDRVVVMREGHIEQVGTPREVYEKPHNLFVARFVGESNEFAGVVTAANGNQLQVTLEGRSCAVLSDRPFAVGEAVRVLLRPEDLRVEEVKGEPPADAFIGEVEERTYKGATLDSEIRLASGTRLLASEFFDEEYQEFDYQPGQAVAVRWVPGWEVVLADEGA